MTQFTLFPKAAISALNGIAIVLVVGGCLDFAFFGHSFTRARIYLVAALGTLTLAALVSRAGARRAESNQEHGASRHGPALPPLWNYVFVVLCFAMAAITATTQLIESRVTGLVVVIVMELGLIAVVVNRIRANAKVGMKFTRVQKAGLAIAFFGPVSALIRLMITSN